MQEPGKNKILFVINPGSGIQGNKSWEENIRNYFTEKPFVPEFYNLPTPVDTRSLSEKIRNTRANLIVAVGGDGTVNIVARMVAKHGGVLGIIPSGSANGMAKELGIPSNAEGALDILCNGQVSNCDAIMINNDQICFHLCDIGINAQLIKYFNEGRVRGMFGYAKVIFKALRNKQKLAVTIHSNNQEVRRTAFMVVLANASKYGTGAVINPTGVLDDGIFEVVVIRKLALSELLRMLFWPGEFNPRKIEIFSGTSVNVTTRGRAHFQIDGEYIGRLNTLHAEILKHYIRIMLPK